jgi:hypothetical protein
LIEVDAVDEACGIGCGPPAEMGVIEALAEKEEAEVRIKPLCSVAPRIESSLLARVESAERGILLNK